MIGAGYRLVMVFRDISTVQTIQTIVQKHCPNAKLDSAIGLEATFVLPQDDREKCEQDHLHFSLANRFN